MQTFHKTIEINYVERRNHWAFRVNNEDHNAPSLKDAKDKIDTLLVGQQRTHMPKQFESIPCFYGMHKGRITSLTQERDFEKNLFVWFSYDDKNVGTRAKVIVTDLFADNEQNTTLIKDIAELDKTRNEIYGNLQTMRETDVLTSTNAAADAPTEAVGTRKENAA